MTKKIKPAGMGELVSAPLEEVSMELNQARLSEWIGQRKFSAALQKLLTVSDLVELQKIKETKSYKGLRVISSGKLADVSSFKELCDAIGCSEPHINEQLLNLRTFGPEFLAFADQSLGYRDMRALRKLPEDQNAALRELAKANNTDALVEFVEKTIESHLTEKTALKEEIKNMGEQIGNHSKHYAELNGKCQIAEAQLKILAKTKVPGESAYSPRTLEVRHESAGLEFGSRINVDAVEAMYEAVLSESAPTQQEQELRVAAIGLAVSAIYARAESLYTRLKDELGDAMPIQAEGRYALSDDEKHRLAVSVKMLNDAFFTKKSKREAERYAEAPVTAGRPKGSKNKSKGGANE